jgi:hypothetical protein
MDPLTGAAIAVGSIIATKALEKTGEKVAEKVWQQTEKFRLFVTLYAKSTDKMPR